MKRIVICMMALGLILGACSKGKTEATGGSEAPTQAEETSSASADPMINKGIGPISSISLGELDQAMVAQGEEVFKAKCTACHKISKKFIGPQLQGVTERRSPEWIMNMVLNPEEMVQKDPIAKQLLIDYNGAPMANQNLTEDEARALLEYFRTKN